MFDLDSWQEILHSLSKNPLRTFLTAFGVFWGIFMLIVMMGAGNGLETGVRSDFGRGASNSFFIWSRNTSMPYKGLKEGRRVEMDNGDYDLLAERLQGAMAIAPRNQLGGFQGGNNVTRGVKTGAFSVLGDYPQVQQIEGLFIDKGRFLNPLDIRDYRKVAVIGTRVEELLFDEGEDPLGEYIRIQGVNFQVIGVFYTGESGERSQRDAQAIYVPFTTFQRAFNFGNAISWFAVAVKPEGSAASVEEQALQLLKFRHKVHPEDPRAFGHFNRAERFKEVLQVFDGIRYLSWFVGFFTLLAGTIGVSNIMLIIVKERTREIGVRRALGAKPWQIVSQIVWEAIALTSLAGYAGLVCGVGLLEAIAWALTNFNLDTGMFGAPYIDLSLAVQALTILVLAGALAGFIPARRALSISPVDALRSE